MELMTDYGKIDILWLDDGWVSPLTREQIDFFHLNLVSLSMVVKVDFDLTMSMFTHK